MSILIRQVEHEGVQTDLFLEGNRIEVIGDCAGRTADTVIEGAGLAVLPTFHNAHTHAAMSCMRGYADDLDLFLWLKDYIWPLEAGLTEEDVYDGARLACLEMIRSGTTFFNDMYWHWHGTARAVQECGLRAALSPVLIDGGDSGRAAVALARQEELFWESRDYGPRILFQLGPHAVYTVSTDSLRRCAEFAQEHDLMIHTHLCETGQEVDDCVKEHGLRPVAYLDSIGFLGPNVTAAHCIHATHSEMEVLAERGVKVLHCPVSNMKLASGKFPWIEARAAGLEVAIGTDGCASNNCLDMGEEMKIAVLLEKHAKADPAALDAQTAWDAATRAGTRMFGLGSGRIAEGAWADLMLVDLDHERLVPGHHLIADMVYSANASCIDTVICDGRILMRNRHVEGQEEIIAKGRAFREKFARRRPAG